MKQIPHIPNYFACEDGHIYNASGRKLKPRPQRDGYLMISIWQKGEGKSKNLTVHRLIALTFIENPDNLPCVNHIDGDKQNNKVENLEWVTYSRNSKHSFELGLQTPMRGFDNPKAHSKEKVHEVCRLLQEGYRNVDIAKITGVHSSFVKSVRAGKAGVEVSKDYNFSSKSRQRTLSEDTVRWVCNKILEGYKNVEIAAMSTNPRITRQFVNAVRNQWVYKDITQQYNFKN